MTARNATTWTVGYYQFLVEESDLLVVCTKQIKAAQSDCCNLIGAANIWQRHKTGPESPDSPLNFFQEGLAMQRH